MVASSFFLLVVAKYIPRCTLSCYFVSMQSFKRFSLKGLACHQLQYQVPLQMKTFTPLLLISLILDKRFAVHVFAQSLSFYVMTQHDILPLWYILIMSNKSTEEWNTQLDVFFSLTLNMWNHSNMQIICEKRY